MTVYKIIVDGEDEGTIHSVSIGHAAREAMLNLSIPECDTLAVTNTHLDVTTMYHDVTIENGRMYYEYTSH